MRPWRLIVRCALLIVALPTASLRADVWLDYQWGEDMVLQAGVKAALHGTAKAGEKVRLSFRGHNYETLPDKTGRWQIDVEPGAAGGPFALTLSGNNTIKLDNVRVADLQLASVFGDGMVLQRGDKAPFFGTALPKSRVSVQFRGQDYTTTTDEAGKWRIDLVPGQAGGPFELSVKGPANLELHDVYVGEVWVCSGQSNMRWPVSLSQDAGKLSLDKPNPLLRLQQFPELGYKPDHPAARFSGWQPAERKAVLAFSGTGYFFGAALQEKLQVPIGLIHCAVDATGIQEWTPGKQLQELKLGPGVDGGHYARRIRPIQPCAIRGVVWYQGEANASKESLPGGYERRLTALIAGWRADWGQGEFPFIYVQLPRIGFGAEQVHNGKLPTAEQKEIVGEWARVRDEQRRVLQRVPNTAMAVYYEHTTGMLHPPQKRAVGDRLALAARGLAYGEKIEYAGPLLESATRAGDDVVLQFRHAAGLTTTAGPPRQFEIARADGKFETAQGRIDGSTIRLPAPKGRVTIRYAYREWPDGNLINGAGLPASPFTVLID